MNRFRVEFIVCILIVFVAHSCSFNDDYVKEGGFADVASISFPSIPIEIANNQEFEKPLINYFNIIKADNFFYMYYLAFDNTTIKSDLDQNLYFAYSNDLIQWNREKVTGEGNLLVANIADASVSYNKESQKPFRLVGRQMIDGENFLVMYKSKDGFNFEFDRSLFQGKYDTQSTCVEQGEGFRLYTRLWNNEHTNRQIGYALFDKEDKCIDSLLALSANYVYNPGVLKINEYQDILMPTYMNNLDGDSDDYKILSYRKKGDEFVSIPNDIAKWLDSEIQWAVISPGWINYNGKSYIFYQTRSSSHDENELGESKFWMIEIQFNYE